MSYRCDLGYTGLDLKAFFKQDLANKIACTVLQIKDVEKYFLISLSQVSRLYENALNTKLLEYPFRKTLTIYIACSTGFIAFKIKKNF